jgi:hypothetical protein
MTLKVSAVLTSNNLKAAFTGLHMHNNYKSLEFVMFFVGMTFVHLSAVLTSISHS